MPGLRSAEAHYRFEFSGKGPIQWIYFTRYIGEPFYSEIAVQFSRDHIDTAQKILYNYVLSEHDHEDIYPDISVIRMTSEHPRFHWFWNQLKSSLRTSDDRQIPFRLIDCLIPRAPSLSEHAMRLGTSSDRKELLFKLSRWNSWCDYVMDFAHVSISICALSEQGVQLSIKEGGREVARFWPETFANEMYLLSQIDIALGRDPLKATQCLMDRLAKGPNGIALADSQPASSSSTDSQPASSALVDVKSASSAPKVSPSSSPPVVSIAPSESRKEQSMTWEDRVKQKLSRERRMAKERLSYDISVAGNRERSPDTNLALFTRHHLRQTRTLTVLSFNPEDM